MHESQGVGIILFWNAKDKCTVDEAVCKVQQFHREWGGSRMVLVDFVRVQSRESG